MESSYKSKSVDELTFTDNGMFQAVLRNPEICAELIERLLHVRIKQIKYPKLEKRIAPYYTTKGVRLDVYLKDEDKIIDVEMQSQPQDALGKRTRYYQSMIDIDALMKGETYPSLKESYILFICKHDPFRDDKEQNYGMPCYTFKNICLENSAVNLNDKSVKVIYNASAYKAEKDKKIRDFLHFIHTNEPGNDEFSNRLSALVEKIKDNEKFRREYAAMNLHDRDITRAAKREGIAEGIVKGISQGERKKAIEVAKNLLADGKYSSEEISTLLQIPIDSFLKLQPVNRGRS